MSVPSKSELFTAVLWLIYFRENRSRARACFGRAHIFLAGDQGAKRLQFRRIWTILIPLEALIQGFDFLWFLLISVDLNDIF